MKTIPFLFLLLCSYVQLVPAFIIHDADTPTVFIAEEKNNEEKNEGAEHKDQKHFPPTSLIFRESPSGLNTAFQVPATGYTAPSLEKLTPPPNFC